MFAIVDVETTGGHAARNSMTELAIVLHDGNQITHKFSSLLNPQRAIPFYIENLTGISHEMVARAPTFAEKAAEIATLLENRIFVAHNVNFDYSFLKTAMEELGYRYNPVRLCTVRYARRVVPGLRSYALANLCKHFEVHNEAAHRALGDAEATAQVFSRLLTMDENEQWRTMAKRNKGEFNLPAHLPSENFHNLPQAPGVYYLLNKEDKPIYIGKAKNLKKRVREHFGQFKESPKSQAFKREIYRIRYKLAGSELMAALLEDNEIRHFRPQFNRAQKRHRVSFGVFFYANQKGAYCLQVNKISGQHGFLRRFYHPDEARAYCAQVVQRYNLNPALCGLRALAVESIPSDEEHNKRVEQFFADHFRQSTKREILVLPGKNEQEYGYIYLVGGALKGMGFSELWPKTLSDEALERGLYPLQSSSTGEAILNRIREEQRKWEELKQ